MMFCGCCKGGHEQQLEQLEIQLEWPASPAVTKLKDALPSSDEDTNAPSSRRPSKASEIGVARGTSTGGVSTNTDPSAEGLLDAELGADEGELKRQLADLGIRGEQLGGLEPFAARFFAASAAGVKRSAWRDEAPEVPDGWTRLEVSSSGIAEGRFENWEKAYHGTRVRSLGSIIDVGLKKPGSKVSAGSTTFHIKARNGVAGAGGDNAIYCSPSLWCASHPNYARLEPLGEGLWLQSVCELQVKPGCYIHQSNTLISDNWDPEVLLDPNWRSNRSIEWVVMDDRDVRVVAVLLRQLGPEAKTSHFGRLARELVLGQPAAPVDSVWKDLLEGTLRNAGHLEPEVGSVAVADNVGTWLVPSDFVSQLGPRERLASRKFSLCGLEGLSLILWPRGDTSAQEGTLEHCAAFISGLPAGVFTIGLTVGTQHQEFIHDFSDMQTLRRGFWTDKSFGYSAFGRTTQMLKDVGHGGLDVKVTIIARESVPLGPQVGQRAISKDGHTFTWQIAEKELHQLLPRQRATAGPMELGGLSGLSVLFFPNEIGAKVELCSIYVVVPIEASVDAELSIGTWKQVLHFDANGRRGDGWGWCYGFPNCCVLKGVRTPGKPLEVTVKVLRVILEGRRISKRSVRSYE